MAPPAEVHVYRDPMRRLSIALFAGQRINHEWHSFTLGSTEPVKVDERLPQDPLLYLDDGAAQSLLDQLWNMGLRPKAVMTADATNKAQAEHLADMRAIAFAKLSIAAPEGVKR
jgi:hypothetical protein